MLSDYRARLYRVIFCAAAAYNLAFGMVAVSRPSLFFDTFQMEPPRYPAIWQCLGMVIGLYGIGYGYAAARLDRARPFIAIGLAGKVLGPIGWVATVNAGEWPLRTLPLIVFDDFIWWLPFTLFLLEDTRWAQPLRASAPYACALINAAAAVAMLVALRGGSELIADGAQRAAYVAQHPVLWRGGWALWMAAALSLLGFYAWWGACLPSSAWATIAFVVAAVGLASDLTAESLFIGWLPRDLEVIQPAGSILTGGVANGLYTVAGVILTLKTKALAGPLRWWAWMTWLSGFCLSAFTLTGNRLGMAISAGALMTLFCPWAARMGWKLQR